VAIQRLFQMTTILLKMLYVSFASLIFLNKSKHKKIDTAPINWLNIE